MKILPEINEFRVKLRDFVYDVEWVDDPGRAKIPRGGFVGMDTETRPVVDGEPLELVLLQAAWRDDRVVHLVPWEAAPRYFERVAKESGCETFWHNAGFDAEVMGGPGNPLLADLLEQGRLWDVAQRYCMVRQRKGVFVGVWKLDRLARDVLRVELDKDESVRMSYSRDAGVLTRRQLKYAAEDAVATVELAATMPQPEPTEKIQVAGALWLYRVGYNGMAVDVEMFDRLREHLEKQMRSHVEVLDLFGYRKGERGVKSVMRTLLEAIEKHEGVAFPRTPKTREPGCGKQSLMNMPKPPRHPFVESYNKFTHIDGVLSKYLDKSAVGSDGRVHPFFNPIVSTGRTSCSNPPLQQPPRKDGVRQLYVPAPPGAAYTPRRRDAVLVAIDYSQQELCFLAEHCVRNFGFSRLADTINAGVCVHRKTASEYFKKPTDCITAEERQFGKVPNFGCPGMLGPASLIPYARGYGVELDAGTAAAAIAAWKRAYPEMEQFLDPEVDEESTLAAVRKYCRDNQMRPENTVAGLRRAIERRLLETMPDEAPDGISKRAFAESNKCNRYWARLFTGREYRNLFGTQACNKKFQGTAADGSKLAGLLLWKAGLAPYIVNFIHDEFIFNFPVDSQLQDRIKAASSSMLRGCSALLRHVKIDVEVTVMDRWWKEACEIRDENGDYVMWTPSQVPPYLADRYPDAEVVADGEELEFEKALDVLRA